MDARSDPELAASLDRDDVRLAEFERSETVGSRSPEREPSLSRELTLNTTASVIRG